MDRGAHVSSGAPSLQRDFAATRMVLDATEKKFVLPAGEKAHERRVRISMQPFAQGTSVSS